MTLNTPREICSMRRAMPNPCRGWRLRVLRIEQIQRALDDVGVVVLVLVHGSIALADSSTIAALHLDCQDMIDNTTAGGARRSVGTTMTRVGTARAGLLPYAETAPFAPSCIGPFRLCPRHRRSHRPMRGDRPSHNRDAADCLSGDDVVERLDRRLVLTRRLRIARTNAEHRLKARRARRGQLGMHVRQEQQLGW